MDYLKTGRLIAKKRKDHDYTLDELSKLLGVSPQAISLWVNGQRFPDPSSQIMLFKVLGLNPLMAFVLSGVIAKSYGFVGFAPSATFGANEYMSLLYALLFTTVIFCLLYVLYKKNIIIKL